MRLTSRFDCVVLVPNRPPTEGVEHVLQVVVARVRERRGVRRAVGEDVEVAPRRSTRTLIAFPLGSVIVVILPVASRANGMLFPDESITPAEDTVIVCPFRYATCVTPASWPSE